MRQIISKFPGTCTRCGRPFPTGTPIEYSGKGLTAHLPINCPVVEASAEVEDGLVTVQGDNRVFRKTRYGLRAGYEHTGHRCEDAPCCGCCD